jgi:hypothetical protein
MEAKGKELHLRNETLLQSEPVKIITGRRKGSSPLYSVQASLIPALAAWFHLKYFRSDVTCVMPYTKCVTFGTRPNNFRSLETYLEASN